MAFYTVPAQDKETFNIYNDKIDAREQITEAVKVAQKEGRQAETGAHGAENFTALPPGIQKLIR